MNSTSYLGPRTPRKEDDLSVSVVMPMYTVRRTLYSVHYSLYSVRRVHYTCLGCTTSCVQCTLYSKLAILNVYPEIYFLVSKRNSYTSTFIYQNVAPTGLKVYHRYNQV